MFTPVPPVPAAPPRTGLIASALTPQGEERWEAGMAWRSERCPEARGFTPACGIETPFAAAAGSDPGANVYYLPPAYRVERVCATRAGSSEEDLAIVRRQAEAAASYMLARELQDGALTRSAPHDTPEATNQVNAFLADSNTTVLAGAYSPAQGLGVLEQAARAGQLGQDVFIHMPVSWVPLLGTDVLVQEGNLLRTLTGARVVADAGYTGTGELGAGTSEVQTVVLTGAPAGGTFTLTYGGSTTAPIPFNATAAQVQAALLALPNLEPGDLTVGGIPGGSWPVTFDAYLGDVALMTADGSGLTGGVTPDADVTLTTPGVAPAAAAGSFLYATGPVQVRLGRIEPFAFTDWQTNQRYVAVERMFAATYDPCTAFAVEIDIPAAS